VALPLGVILNNPKARGPRSFFVRCSFFRGTISGVDSWAALRAPIDAIAPSIAIKSKPRYRIFWTGGNAGARFLAFLTPGSDLAGEEIPMNIHDKAPEFTLQDENGKEISLKDLRGKTVVLYFYPRADTPGCTIEAQNFRDAYKRIQKTGVVLMGISPDTPKSQKKFQEKFSLPFTLLADADKKVADAFGVLKEKNMYGKKVMGIVRTTFIIGPDGKIQHIFPKVKVEGHAEEVLGYLKEAAKIAS
jgi:thioredoxin-dependent peroxiredoxin